MYVLCNFAITIFLFIGGFPGSSDGKESAFNAGDLGLIPGLGRSPGGWDSYPLKKKKKIAQWMFCTESHSEVAWAVVTQLLDFCAPQKRYKCVGPGGSRLPHPLFGS